MTLPVLPAAATLTPATIAQHGSEIVAWAEGSDDIDAVRDYVARWAAVTEYVRRTSREGVAEAESVLRRLETQVGKLLGPAKLGRPTLEESSVAPEDIGRHDRSEFRLMAEHPEIVDAVIAASTDSSPPSRRKVIAAIRGDNDRRVVDAELIEARKHAPQLARLISELPDTSRSYLVTVRVRSTPEFLKHRLPAGFEIVNIQEETNEHAA